MNICECVCVCLCHICSATQRKALVLSHVILRSLSFSKVSFWLDGSRFCALFLGPGGVRD